MTTAPTAPSPFAATRLRQIQRLVTLEREHGTEFNRLGHTLTCHAIFAMVLDCRSEGVPPAALAVVLDPTTPALEASV